MLGRIAIPLVLTLVCTSQFALMSRRAPMAEAAAPDSAVVAIDMAGAGPPVPLITEIITSSGDFTISNPIHATGAPGDFTRLFVAENEGRIMVVNLKTGDVNATPFLDLTGQVAPGNEQGLLGLAFHPQYQTNGFFFINYTDLAGDTVIARLKRSDASPDIADPASAVTLLHFDQPFANHNGGHLAFGPNGFLFVGLGDGGSSGDPFCYAQRFDDDAHKFLGKMLRLDVNQNVNTPPYYGIPAGNPFGGAGEPPAEVWSLGLRNPWRFSFDRATGDLYIGDVGQALREEINYAPASSPGGENYGWKMMEGELCFDPFPLDPDCPTVAPQCFDASLNDPLRSYDHAFSCAVVGGYVYRGCAIPALQGYYFFSDFCSNRLWVFNNPTGALDAFEDWTTHIPMAQSRNLGAIQSFGEDTRGELYLVDRDGDIFKIVPASGSIKFTDIDCSGSVGIMDFLAILANWGPCDGCAADTDGDHEVGIDDFLSLLAQWG